MSIYDRGIYIVQYNENQSVSCNGYRDKQPCLCKKKLPVNFSLSPLHTSHTTKYENQ